MRGKKGRPEKDLVSQRTRGVSKKGGVAGNGRKSGGRSIFLKKKLYFKGKRRGVI